MPSGKPNDTNRKFFLHSRESWEAMIEAFKEAQHSIDFEQYILADFSSGKIGRRFADVLKEKAHSGVKVRIILDRAGSWEFFWSSVSDELRKAGVLIRFNRVIPRMRENRFFQSFLRDHRRLIVVDDRIALLGGTAVKENAADWRDTHVRLEGAVVKTLADPFETAWSGARGRTGFHIEPPAQSSDRFAVVSNGILPRHRFISRIFLDAIRGAHASIYLTTPYFVPTRPIFRALRLAALRGVDVRMLLPLESDSALANITGESFFHAALRSGIRVYRYEPSFLHAKTMTIDGIWSTVGSANFDRLSFNFNYELNVISYDADFAARLEGHFFDDLKTSKEIELSEWNKRGFLRKALEKLAYLLRPLV